MSPDRPLYPLRFQPILRRYIWGGRRLETVLGRQLGPGDDYAESWEVCDRGEDQSIVAGGPLAGVSLGELLRERGERLLGRHHPQPRFPLLLKLLDATHRLSVQVHPNDEQAARLEPPDWGKTEAWVVLAARPGASIFAGLKPGVDRKTLADSVSRGTCEQYLHRFQPAEGDCVFIPAGTIHALGEGLLVAEIQQSSDTTYRLFDWNRVGPDGKPRELHIEPGLEVIDFQRGPVEPQTPQPTARPHVSRLVECDRFILDRWKFDAPAAIEEDGRCHILVVQQGSIWVKGDPTGAALPRGSTVLLPAALGATQLVPQGEAVVLDAYLP